MSASSQRRPFLTAQRTGELIVVARNGGDELRGRSIDAILAAAADRSPAHNPLLLAGDELLQVDLGTDERARLLSALQPSAGLLERLEDVESEDDDWNMASADERRPVLATIELEGRRWGWFLTQERWMPLPGAFQEDAEQIAAGSAWMSASMTGAVIWVNCKLDGSVALTSFKDDEEPFTFAVEYDVTDPARAASDAFETLFWDWDFVEPWCPQGDDDGWEITLSIGEAIPTSVVGGVMDRLWKPCTEHADDPDELIMEMDGRTWRWQNEGWRADPAV